MPPQKRKKPGPVPKKPLAKKGTPKKPAAAAKNAAPAAKKKPRKKTWNRWTQPPPVIVEKPLPVLTHHIYPSVPVDRTVRAVEKAVRTVVDDHVVRCTVTKNKMAAICEKLQNMYGKRKIGGYDSSYPFLEATFDEAFNQMDEKVIGMDKGMFRRELIKYVLIAMSKFSCLSKVSLMSIVIDLDAADVNLYEYEKGAPAKVISSVHQFYGLTQKEFENLHLHTSLEMKMRYYQEVLEYHKEMAAFLERRHKEVVAKAKELKRTTKHNRYTRAARDMFFCYPEGRIIEGHLLDAWERNHDIEKTVKTEYYRLDNLYNKVVIPIREGFRTYMLAGNIGARSEKYEKRMDDMIARTPLEVQKKMTGGKRKPRPSYLNDDHPVNRIIPTPMIHLVHDCI